MKFTTKLKAENGWKAALLKGDGTISYVDIVEWGLRLVGLMNVQLIPLDAITGRSIFERKNFLMIMNPNESEEHNNEMLHALANKKAKELGVSAT
jgi:hypothetical protein